MTAQVLEHPLRQQAQATAKLSVEDFTEYMTQIEAWCAEQGYQVMEAA